MDLSNRIRHLIDAGAYVVGVHAVARLDQRDLLEWQIIDGMQSATMLVERPDSKPNPVAEFELLLPDGTPVKAVWALLSQSGVAKLVTVHFLPKR